MFLARWTTEQKWQIGCIADSRCGRRRECSAERCCRCADEELSEAQQQAADVERADRGLFVQELLLSTLAEGLRLDDSDASSSSSGAESDPGGDPLQPPPPSGGVDHVNNVGRNAVSDKAAARQRNMVNHLESSKANNKEPPSSSVAKH